jgi:hypothetical protein
MVLDQTLLQRYRSDIVSVACGLGFLVNKRSENVSFRRAADIDAFITAMLHIPLTLASVSDFVKH